MTRLTKTDQVVNALQGHTDRSIAEISQATGFKPNEISGILASLQRQERVCKNPDIHQGKQRWVLLRIEKIRAPRNTKPIENTAAQIAAQRTLRLMAELQHLFASLHHRSVRSTCGLRAE